MLGEHVMADGTSMNAQGMMTDYLIILAASVIILLMFPALMLWGWKKGQFRDIEEAKHRMMELEEERDD